MHRCRPVDAIVCYRDYMYLVFYIHCIVKYTYINASHTHYNTWFLIFFEAWMYIGFIGACLFILIQLILLIDFAHKWNETW